MSFHISNTAYVGTSGTPEVVKTLDDSSIGVRVSTEGGDVAHCDIPMLLPMLNPALPRLRSRREPLPNQRAAPLPQITKLQSGAPVSYQSDIVPESRFLGV